MAFTDNQNRQLHRALDRRHIRERQVDGRTLSYLEGWHVIAEANRIFGNDAWDRETISTQCVWQKYIDYRYTASYLTKVRISVRAGGMVVVREGLGSGESSSAHAAQAHEYASKASETDATKRALSTFGNPFGLSLYRGQMLPRGRKLENVERSNIASLEQTRAGPVRSFGKTKTAGGIDKGALELSEPKRYRDKDHLRLVASKPCLICDYVPSQAHHLRIAQPRALGLKVSDEFTVPLCATHHAELHARGDERAWWHDHGVDPLPIARRLWEIHRGLTLPNKLDASIVPAPSRTASEHSSG